MKFLHLALCRWIFSNAFKFIVYGNWNRIFIRLLCENYINLNYVELIDGGFQVCYFILPFCTFLLLIFESLILKLQLKILTYVLKNNYNIYWNYMQLCSVFFKSPVNVLSYFDNLIKIKQFKKLRRIENTHIALIKQLTN